MSDSPKIIDICQCEVHLIGYRNSPFSKIFWKNGQDRDRNNSSGDTFNRSSNGSVNAIEETNSAHFKSKTLNFHFENKESQDKQSKPLKSPSKINVVKYLSNWKAKLKVDKQKRNKKNLRPNLIIYQETDPIEIGHLQQSRICRKELGSQDLMQDPIIGSNDKPICSPKVPKPRLPCSSTTCKFKKFPMLTSNSSFDSNVSNSLENISVYVDPATFLSTVEIVDRQESKEPKSVTNSTLNSPNNIEQRFFNMSSLNTDNNLVTNITSNEDTSTLRHDDKGPDNSNSSNLIDDVKTININENSLEESKISPKPIIKPIAAKRQKYLVNKLNLLQTTDGMEIKILENNTNSNEDIGENSTDRQFQRHLSNPSPRKNVFDPRLDLESSAESSNETNDQNKDNKLNGELIDSNDQSQASNPRNKLKNKPNTLPKPNKPPFILTKTSTSKEENSGLCVDISRSDDFLTQNSETFPQNCDDSDVKDNKLPIIIPSRAAQETSNINSEQSLLEVTENVNLRK